MSNRGNNACTNQSLCVSSIKLISGIMKISIFPIFFMRYIIRSIVKTLAKSTKQPQLYFLFEANLYIMTHCRFLCAENCDYICYRNTVRYEKQNENLTLCKMITKRLIVCIRLWHNADHIKITENIHCFSDHGSTGKIAKTEKFHFQNSHSDRVVN